MVLRDETASRSAGHPPSEQDWTMQKSTIIVSQIVMTFVMAACMSGIMLLIALGPSAAWRQLWPTQFLMAWPIAFVLSMVAWPLSMGLARRVTRTVRASDAS
jgi:hypothetical protein